VDLVDPQTCDTSYSGESVYREDRALALVGKAEIIYIHSYILSLVGLYCLNIQRIVNSPHRGVSPQTHRSSRWKIWVVSHNTKCSDEDCLGRADKRDIEEAGDLPKPFSLCSKYLLPLLL